MSKTNPKESQVAPRKWKIAEVEVTQLVETEVNANEMTDEEYQRLVENVRITGGLSSAISCYQRESDGKFVIINGNHRLRAAIENRLRVVPIVYADESMMSKDEKLALQISHNSLHGSHNRSILKRLFDEIQSIDFKQAAFIDVSEIEPIDTSGVGFTMESEHYSVSLVLYRKDFDLLKDLLGVVAEKQPVSDLVMLADGKENEDEYLKLLSAIRQKYDIRSVNIAFSKILELAKKQMANE